MATIIGRNLKVAISTDGTTYYDLGKVTSGGISISTDMADETNNDSAGWKEEKVADKLGVTRLRVNKALSEARARGLVRITFNTAFAACAELEAALRARVGLLKGLEEAVIARVIRDRITLMPGGQALVATMRGNGGYAALVSGGFTAFTGAIAGVLGFDENRANTLLVESGRLTGAVAEPILGRAAKVQALEEISVRLGISPAEAVAVGDGANDLGMLGLAGMGVALHAKPSVQAECQVRVNHGDLSALLYLQGYRRDEFRA
jgi:phosphoserine phosphatase SerB